MSTSELMRLSKKCISFGEGSVVVGMPGRFAEELMLGRLSELIL